MTGLFWLGVGWLAYVYVGYPILLAVLALVRRVRPDVRDDALPRVSVLLAARNEERDIGWKLRQTLEGIRARAKFRERNQSGLAEFFKP